MISFTSLRKQLGITQPALTRLIADGMPHDMDGRRKLFDERAVAKWLVETGKATIDDNETVSGPVARTRREVADYFGVNLRTVAEWCSDARFPGQPGNRGRRDGHFPLDAISEWIAARDALRRGGPRVETTGHQLRDEMLEIKIQRERRRLEEDRGRLAPIDEMAARVARQINTAKQILDSLPEKAARALPDNLPRDTRTAVVKRIRREVIEVERVGNDLQLIRINAGP